MIELLFPSSQRELLRAARGTATQAAFAKLLGVDRTCLSRYESEKLGAPTPVLNYCLKSVAETMHPGATASSDVQQALAYARRAVDTLERVAKTETRRPTHKRAGRLQKTRKATEV
jgi:DNA-binding XRE family transcriptional regulator